MGKFLIRVTESVNHDYEIEAESEDEALAIYYSYTIEQLEELDLDGVVEWAASPWEVEKLD